MASSASVSVSNANASAACSRAIQASSCARVSTVSYSPGPVSAGSSDAGTTGGAATPAVEAVETVEAGIVAAAPLPDSRSRSAWVKP